MSTTPQPKVPPAPPDDGGYEHVVELDGSTAFIFHHRNQGLEITVSGWDSRHYNYQVGERVILTDAGKAYRYRIKDVRRPLSPPTQYFMDCEFAPHPDFTTPKS
jgi:hypothetical protein